MVRIQQPDLGALDTFAAKQDSLNRQDAIRRILREYLIDKGLLK